MQREDPQPESQSPAMRDERQTQQRETRQEGPQAVSQEREIRRENPRRQTQQQRSKVSQHAEAIPRLTPRPQTSDPTPRSRHEVKQREQQQQRRNLESRPQTPLTSEQARSANPRSAERRQMTVEQLPCQRTPPLLREETEVEMRRRQDNPSGNGRRAVRT